MEANAWNGTDPSFLVSFDVEAEALVYRFISSFASTVGLRVKATRRSAIYTGDDGEMFPKS